MKNFFSVLLFFSFLKCQVVYGQDLTIDKTKFFTDTSIINATITTNLTHVFRKKEATQYPANFSATLPGGSLVNDPVLLEIRGHFRKDFCYMPPLKVIFKSKKTSVMKPLGSLKLVSQCKLSAADEQYLLKEFLVYKIYNLLTDMSFRVRLLNLNLVDSANKKKPITEYAFLLEDIKDLAERNNCLDMKSGKVNTEATNRRQMTIVAVFEYMIGNTDWAVPVNHNIRLIIPTTDSLHRPYAVPYDFDYSGFVNTDYAIPDEKLNIPNVRERLYRGFPRTMTELNDVLDIFKKQKSNIYALINNFDLLNSRTKKDLFEYLDEFFDLIRNPTQINNIFIQEARTE
ncbi:MAG: hypothetical protein ACHQF0_01220 [Chitinophagales bacterium]